MNVLEDRMSEKREAGRMGVKYINRTVIDEGRLGRSDKRNSRRRGGKSCMIWGDMPFGLRFIFIAAGITGFMLQRRKREK